MSSKTGPIPEEWRKAVLRILQNGKFGREILLTYRAFADWEADSLGAFQFELREPLISALAKPGVVGKLIPDQPEPGQTYAFWMHHRCANGEIRKFYAKVCLRRDRISIKILSAHLPDKGDEL
jgi:hypothetical protein